MAYRKKCTALTTKMKFWPEECVAVLQIRCWLFMAVVQGKVAAVLWSGGWSRKLLVPTC